MKILAQTRPSDVCDVCDAINAIGALAVAPRRVDLLRSAKQRRPELVESPILGGYFFAAMTDDDWHQCKADRIAFTVLQPISEPEWRRVEAFCQRAEMDYQVRMGQLEAGRRLSEYNPGDALQLLGGLFADHLATFMRLDESGQVPMIKAVVQGVELMGKPVEVTVDPVQARKWAAE